MAQGAIIRYALYGVREDTTRVLRSQEPRILYGIQGT